MSSPERMRQTVAAVVKRFINNEGVNTSELAEIAKTMDEIGTKHGCDLIPDIVQCCLAMADKIRENKALPTQEHDQRGRIAGYSLTINELAEQNRQKREECYKLICGYLQTPLDEPTRTFNEAALHDALQSENAEWLTYFYTWLTENPKYRLLLVSMAPANEDLLRDHIHADYRKAMGTLIRATTPEQDQNQADVLDIAENWANYQVQRKQHYAGACVLFSLAMTEGNIFIGKRIEYFRKAKAYLKVAKWNNCQESRSTEFDDWTGAITDRIALAELQKEMLKMLDTLAVPSDLVKTVEATLKCNLCDVDQLWGTVLVPLRMNTMCLRVLALADIRDQRRVFHLWGNLLEE
ncbi:hypothetical protein SARC_10737, partial [Sphaeroforma arctica JP610]